MHSLPYLIIPAAVVSLSNAVEHCQINAPHPPTRLVKFPLSEGPLPSLFLVEDYPPEALSNHWEGDVVVDLMIDREGHVSKCIIFQSSGHEALDEKTCDVLKGRARFAPAQGSNGIPVEGTCRTYPFRWRI
jgi:protein TonB